ncbi:DUF6489 family protein [Novosphingopyxis sp. YJ-S2-01]|uniref:DUF6489 family protein n=1 Tax=Novosphingopyxis sp. YJ-S2-01 TaxID=2794021 RepID=UPI0018DCDF78|nr:DUF6489 family protein [Novosphingopyxis sp. YJ-S2-01]MBH9536668.1 hypothetical protein [Novosphingopyxis sp. YJ-S2-01]
MKMNIEINCTPEEARRFMGLPDVTKANEIYVDNVAQAMKGATNLEQLETFAKQMAPMGQMGLKLFQNFMEGAATSAVTGGKSSSKPRDS